VHHGWLFDHLRWFFAEFGYWAVLIVLLLENAGVPVPGETTLLFASFLAYSEHKLRLHWIIGVGVLAATLGDNLGYWIGRRGGRPFLERHQRFFHVSDSILERGERLFARHGAVTIFFARFIFGMRIIAGPLAGVLHMEWRRFLLFNFLGAVTWVTAITFIGYFFGSQWERLTSVMGRANIVIVVLVIAGALFVVWRQHKQR
jgi:membrane protein DedA with SNARE-associated domain